MQHVLWCDAALDSLVNSSLSAGEYLPNSPLLLDSVSPTYSDSLMDYDSTTESDASMCDFQRQPSGWGDAEAEPAYSEQCAKRALLTSGGAWFTSRWQRGVDCASRLATTAHMPLEHTRRHLFVQTPLEGHGTGDGTGDGTIDDADRNDVVETRAGDGGRGGVGEAVQDGHADRAVMGSAISTSSVVVTARPGVQKLGAVQSSCSVSRGLTPWARRFEELVRFKQGAKHCRVPLSQGPLGRWVLHQKAAFRAELCLLYGLDACKLRMRAERARMLCNLGFEWGEKVMSTARTAMILAPGSSAAIWAEIAVMPQTEATAAVWERSATALQNAAAKARKLAWKSVISTSATAASSSSASSSATSSSATSSSATSQSATPNSISTAVTSPASRKRKHPTGSACALE